MATVHLALIVVCTLTVVGFKNADMHWQLFQLSLAPFGRHICAADAPFVSIMTFWDIASYKSGRSYFGRPGLVGNNSSQSGSSLWQVPPAYAQQFGPYVPPCDSYGQPLFAAQQQQQQQQMFAAQQQQQPFAAQQQQQLFAAPPQHFLPAHPSAPLPSAPRMSEIE
jgi:hypothetical protein